MSKPVSEWDEAYILSLPKENNEIERKGSKKLDLTAGADENGILDELAKQLSAFANTGGGRLIYGLKDDGTVDSGGVSTQIKRGGTKEWLERQIPGLTEYEILGFGVHEIEPRSADSQIQAGKALYIVDIPDSDRAPHQSRRDWRYYVRLGSQSLPAPHKIIEDIRNRQEHPRISLGEATVEIQSAKQEAAGRNMHSVAVALKMTLVNSGKLKSTNTFLLLKPEQGNFYFLFDKEIASGVTGTRAGYYEWELNRPLPPQAEISFRTDYRFQTKLITRTPSFRQWYEANGSVLLEAVAIEWTIFADSATPQTGRITMGDIGLVSKLNQATSPQ